MTNPNWYNSGIEHIWQPYGQFPDSPAPLAVERTEGCRIYLADGRSLVDGVSSWWSAAHGYNHADLLAAAHKQLDIMPHVMFGGLAHEPAYNLAARLSAITPGSGELSRVFFADSGSIATEVAMKIALQYWRNLGKVRKEKFVCLHHGYHGDTFGAMSVSDPQRGMHKAFRNNVVHHYALEMPQGEYELAEFAATLEAIAPQTAAFIMEPLVQGAGGMIFHSPDSLAEIRRLCAQNNILFIADEIATGFARTGTMFACEQAGIVPDIMLLGKGLTGGVVGLAAVLAREEIYQSFVSEDREKALMHGPTYMANALACAVANASLDLFASEPRLQQANQIETWLLAELQELRQLPQVLDVRVQGAIGVVQLEGPNILELRKQFIAKNVWIRPFGEVIYLMPPLVISQEELAELMQAVGEVVRGL